MPSVTTDAESLEAAKATAKLNDLLKSEKSIDDWTEEEREQFMLLSGQASSMYDLSDRITFDLGLWSLSKEVQHAVDVIEAELEKTDSCKGMQSRNLRKHLRGMLLNLSKAFLISPLTYVAYSRGGTYPQERNYNPSGITNGSMSQVANGLLELEYVDHEAGKRNPESGESWKSRIRAKRKFGKRLTAEFGIAVSDVIETQLNPIRRKNTDGHYAEYKGGPAVKRMRSQLEQYNALLIDANISLSSDGSRLKNAPGKTAMLIQRQVHRVFQDYKLQLNGRFYGPWWINASEEIRSHILIDGEPTIEADFNAMQLHVLYSMRGLNYYDRNGIQTDPYLVDMDEPDPIKRKARKRLWSFSFNVESKPKAKQAFNFWARDQDDYGQLFEYDSETILNEFLQCHPTIAEFQYQSIGLKTQNSDARVAEYIISELVNKGIVVLAIHDSFIVKEEYKELLLQVMKDAVKECGFTSIPEIHVS
jgi:hypothetical protein